MRLYVDGELLAQNAVTSAPAYTGFWRVGGDNLSGWPSRPSSDYFTGQLDETAVYPTALSSSAVAAHFQLGQGSAVDSDGPTDFYGRTALADDPTVYWRLDETTGTLANDSSGDSADGTYGGGVTLGRPTTVDGSAHAAGFSGTASGIVHSNATLSSSATFSAEAWVRTTTTDGGTVFGFADEATGTATTYDKQVWMDDDGHFVGGVDDGSHHTVTSPDTYNDGGWHHVALTQGPSGLRLYVDGSLVDSDATATSQQFDGFWRVGDTTLAGWSDASTSEALAGDIDEFAAYGHVLTAAQIAAHDSAGDSHVPDVAPPTTPADFSVVQSGGGAKLSWDASLDNVGVTAYQVYRSDVNSPTVDNLVHTVTATAAAAYSFTDTGLALGTWTYHVVAVDAATNASAPTDDVPVVVYDVVPPTAPTLSAAAGSNTVSLSWTASTDARGVTGYAVYRSATTPVDTTGAPLATTDSLTLSYEDAGLSVGAKWYYAVVASDGSGNTTTSNEVSATTADHVAPSAPNATLVATAGSATISWPASTDDVGVTGYRIYRRLASASTPTVLVTVSGSTLSHVDSPATAGAYVYQVSAVDAAGNESDLSSPLAFTATKVADTTAPTAPRSPHAVVSGSQVTLTWLASTDNVKVVRYEIYRSKTSGFVPSAASLLGHTTRTKLVDPATPKGTWYYRIEAVDAAGNHSTKSSQVKAVVTKALDKTRPVPPTVLKASVRTRTVTVSWSGAKDNTKVTHYLLYRGTTASFTPSTATQVASTTHLSASNVVPRRGTYYYRVIALDAVGNKSQASIALKVVVGTHKSATVLLTPTADSYVNEAAPTTNFGAESNMASRGHLGYISYFSYALPKTPAGMKLTSVTLQLRTTTDPTAGSAGKHFVKLTTGSWTERRVTWKNRPKPTGSTLGFTPSHTLANHAYAFHLSAAALRSHTGHATTLELTSTGTDSLRFWSSEYPTPSYRPALVLVYSPV